MKFKHCTYCKTTTKNVRNQLKELILSSGPALYTLDVQLPKEQRSYDPYKSDFNYKQNMKHVMEQLAGLRWYKYCPHFWSLREANMTDKLVLSHSQTHAVGLHYFHYHALFVDVRYPLNKMEKALEKAMEIHSLPMGTFWLQPVKNADKAIKYMLKQIFADENGHCDTSAIIPSDLLFAGPKYRCSLFVRW